MGIDPDTWRVYQLAQIGIAPGTAEELPAVLLDELLEVHRVVTEVTQERQRG